MGQQDCYSNLAKLRQALYAGSRDEADTVGILYTDVVKVLVDDRQDEGTQLTLLVMLQEAGSSYQSGSMAYDAVESLKSAFGALKRTTKYNVQSQTLIAMTTVILCCESVDYAQLYEVVELLVEIVVQVKRNHPLVRAASSNCLREIELCHPGSVVKHLDQLWATFGKDHTWACQALALLLALGTAVASTPTGAAGDEEARSLQGVSTLVGRIPRMTSAAATTMMHSLLASDRLAGGLPAPLLKLCCSQFSSCYELPLVQLMLTMQGEACREAWWQELRLAVVQRLVDSLQYPKSQQALTVSWLGSALAQTVGQPGWCFRLLPRPRDDVTQQGLRLQAALAAGQEAWGGPVIMLDAVVPYLRQLKRRVRLAPGNFGIHLLFHVLYQLYADLKSTAAATPVAEEITRLVINMAVLGPLYCRSLLSFLRSVEVGFPKSTLSQVVLTEAVETVTEQSWDHCLEGSALESCLLVLGAAVQKPGNLCRPKQLYHFIQRLVGSRGHLSWTLGNQLVDLCCCVVLHQGDHSISSDLCTMLSYLMASSEDVDVKSRAKLLYAALSVLSESKARQLLQSSSQDPSWEAERGPNVLSDFPLPSSGACPPEVVRLERLVPGGSCLQPSDQRPPAEEAAGGLAPAHLLAYWAFLEAFVHVVHVPCTLRLESEEPQFAGLMGLQLNLTPPEGWGTAQGLEATVFWKNDRAVTTTVSLSPRTPAPCSISVRAEFTSLDSCSHVCWLEPLQVHFADLLLPLPVPEEHLAPDDYRPLLWNSLWELLSGSGHQSSLRLGPPGPQLWRQLCEGLAPYVVRWQPRGLRAAFVLPPRSPVLVAVAARGPHLVASLRLQDWQLLPPVHAFLRTLVSGREGS